MLEQNSLSKESLLKSIENDFWSLNEMAIALCAKNNNRLNESDKIEHVTVLTEKNIEEFLKQLNNKLPTKDHFRFQIALCISNHWFALDVFLKDKTLSFIYIDSVRGLFVNPFSNESNESISKLPMLKNKKTIKSMDTMKNIFLGLIKKFITVSYCFYDICLDELNLQKDRKSCAIFTLHNIFVLQNFANIYEELSNLNAQSKQEFSVNLEHLPINLLKILRPLQTLDKIPSIPDKIKNEPIKKSKQFMNKDLEPTLNSIFKINIDNNFNKFINYKKDAFIKIIKQFLEKNDFKQVLSQLEEVKSDIVLDKINTRKNSVKRKNLN